MDTTTKLVINLDKLHNNIREILSYKKGSFLFVIKANAYGHGYKEIVKELEQYSEIEFIGVAIPNEALYLSKITSKRIVVLGYTTDDLLKEIVCNDIIPTIFEYRQAQLLPNRADVFINIDTGFNRLGCDEKLYKSLLSDSNINVVAAFTHLRLRSTDDDLEQVLLFHQIINDVKPKFYSISDSIGYTRYQLDENLYRIGAAMFGYTSRSEVGNLALQEVSQLETVVTRVKEIHKNTKAFYRSTLYKSQTVATIQIGYADGLPRTMPDDCYVVINDEKCKYIEIGMDQSIIDITNTNVLQGDKVIIFGEDGLSLEVLSNQLKTNKNNILTSIDNRVVREYIRNNNVIKQTSLWEENNEN